MSVRAAVRARVSERTLALVGVLLAAAFALVPHVANQYLTTVAFMAMVFLILAYSWNLLAGYAGQISLGHAGFFGMGAFISAWATTPGPAGLPEYIAMPALAAIVVGGLGAALIALVIGPAIFRLHGHYFAVGTLALAELIRVIMIDARGLTGGNTGFYVATGSELLRYYYGLGFLILTVVTTFAVLSSRSGLGMRSVKGDTAAADTLGVYPLKYKMYAFVVSSFFAGVAGGLFAQYTTYINPASTLGIVWTVDTIVIVILGGMSTVLGPVFGLAVFMVLDTFLVDVVGRLATTVEGGIIILVVLAAPEGLYGYFVRYVNVTAFSHLNDIGFEESSGSH